MNRKCTARRSVALIAPALFASLALPQAFAAPSPAAHTSTSAAVTQGDGGDFERGFRAGFKFGKEQIPKACTTKVPLKILTPSKAERDGFIAGFNNALATFCPKGAKPGEPSGSGSDVARASAAGFQAGKARIPEACKTRTPPKFLTPNSAARDAFIAGFNNALNEFCPKSR
ncbi:hypothetical protein [Streptomyces sp. PSKA30]|uniref:hypothetical protein n=1 Tax=Streptomyces sp. PSKA30 TaxID=2874597 RepID=UPI001CD16ECA|nr:hypothetical protein [Streptomyces sp. PSKA30]MBZ9641547.1 hypothetical protein [Streptomyces sp. PSKA30]